MPKLAANLSWLYQELPLLERFAAAAAAGFKAVEILFPYEAPAETVAALLAKHGLQQALFNLPPGDWAKGERGFAAVPSREATFEAAFEQALAYARVVKCPKLHVMAGMVPAGVSRAAMTETFVANLKRAAPKAAAAGIMLVLEPLNDRDVPGYYMSTTTQAAEICAAVGAANLKIQFDVYHAQIMEGDVTRRIERLAPQIGHVQIAGNPDRNEPDIGELDYHHVLAVLDRVGYDGWIGLEYKPRGATNAGLGWAKRYGIVAP
jgi:hydroxypyruvate isomerase